MRDLAVLFLHLLTTAARLAGPGGARSVVAESLLVKQQLLILNRSRKRSPRLRLSDRIIAGFCALLMRSRRLLRSAIVLKPSDQWLDDLEHCSDRVGPAGVTMIGRAFSCFERA